MTLALTLIAAGSIARAQDEPAPFRFPSIPPPSTPAPLPAGPPPAAPLTEDQVEAIVARVVARELAAARPSPSAPPIPTTPAAPMLAVGPIPPRQPDGWFPLPPSPAMPTPQAAMPAVVPTTMTARAAVLVPAGPISRTVARLGRSLVRIGEPRVRTFALAPVQPAPVPRVIASEQRP